MNIEEENSMSVSIEEKHLTLSVKVIITIICATVSIVSSFFYGFHTFEDKLNHTIRGVESQIKSVETQVENVKTENKIQELRYENLKIEVERNKLTLERMREEIQNGRF